MELTQRLLSTRRGTMMLGIGAAVIAGILLLVYLNQYRKSVSSSNQAVTVLIAKSLIPKGTPGDVIGSDGLFQTTRILKTQIREGALTDAALLRGKVVADDIYPNQQLTIANLVPSATQSVVSKLSGDWRAIAVPIDSAHGLVGQVETGDHIDIYAGFSTTSGSGGVPTIKTLMTDVLVLRAPSSAAGGAFGAGRSASNIVLRAKPPQAAKLAWAVDNGRLWFVLRPSVNASATKTTTVTATTLAGSGGSK